MIRRRVLYALLVLLLLSSFSVRAAAQGGVQSSDSFTFRNGLVVSGDFYKFYRSVDDPDRLFGLPYSIVFEDPLRRGIQIQYFDRVRMDYDPSQPEGQRVTLADLGSFAHNDAQTGQPIPTAANMCRTVNTFSVCYAFREMYDRYGERIFGTPITNAEYADNGRLVQYFTRARMEWRVEMPPGKRVVLTELGKIDFDKRIGNPQLKKPNGDISGSDPLALKLYAFVARPLIANGDKQYVYAVLYDQNDQPVENVTIAVTVSTPQGAPPIPNPASTATNNLGYASVEFPVQGISPNQEVLVTIKAEVPGGTTTTATTWFRVWW